MSEFLASDHFSILLSFSVTLVLVGVGVVFLVISGIHWSSFQKLLEEGEYSRQRKKGSLRAEAVETIYWLLITALYLGYSFVTQNWGRSWIIWLVAGCVFAAIEVAFRAVDKNKE